MGTADQVSMWEEMVEIPTYETGEPDKNPMFLEKRVYQGSSGKVYPLPVIDKIYDRKIMKKWKVVYLENKYLRIAIMPELGGRIQRALDKTNGYDFVYYNHVIKPALVGLAGPWISGGIEFNWPQHHRPSTFSPVEYSLKEHTDGSKTVFLGEIDGMYGTKETMGLTLRPGKAYLEIDVQLYNRTQFPQTFLWWANPAYAVNDDTQSVFPPDVHAVYDHGKRDVSSFPIATGTYYKVDYSAGIDISRYKNIPVPTSYMAYRSSYDFVGGYDNGKRAGLLHVADHHVSPGKKQWTWGCGDFGKAWNRNLTDSDGPYIELMTGVYTDNQPDFSWLMPMEEKRFTQYFMPYKEIGVIKNANRDFSVNLEVCGGTVRAFAYASSERDVRVVLKGRTGVYEDKRTSLSPERTYRGEFSLREGDGENDLRLSVLDGDGREQISYRPEEKKDEKLPAPAKAIPAPENIKSNEELFLAGLHLEQYRHATYEPDGYYLEGLRRDPGDIRIHNAYGLLLLRRGRFSEAEKHFRAAVGRLTLHNTNPYDGEPFYNLGVALKYQGRYREAYDVLFKSCWNGTFQCSGYYELASIDAMRGNWKQALEHLKKSVDNNYENLKARGLMASVYRKAEDYGAAEAVARESVSIDPLDFRAYYELCRVAAAEDRESDAAALREKLLRLLDGSSKNYEELSLEYAQAGLFDEAADILKNYLAQCAAGRPDPMAYYYLGYYSERMGDGAERDAYYQKAAEADSLYCFPNRLCDVIVLQSAQKANPADAKAFYYLGNFWYDRRQHELAIRCFETSRELDGTFPTVHRNLALAYYNQRHDAGAARKSIEQAFELDRTDARVFLELDQLYKKIGIPPEKRLKNLEKHMELVEKRDDLYVEYITLLNTTGQADEALKLMRNRRFHPWEGGEGKITKQYVYACVEKGKEWIEAKKYAEAAEILERARVYPANLGEGKLYGTQENHINYYLGCALQAMGEEEKSREAFREASVGLSEPASAMFYNDQPPETIFYQGAALLKLGKKSEAQEKFDKLIRYGEKHLGDHVVIDYFAVSLPDFLIFDDDLDKRNKVHCRYLIGLGHLGLGRRAEAAAEFGKALRLDPNHQGLVMHQRQ